MTKPVQIQRRAMKGFQPKGYPPPLCLPHKRGMYCLYSEAVAHEAAALSAVRSLLEAKAKEFKVMGSELGVQTGGTFYYCADELLALAAALTDDAGEGA